MNFAQPFWLIAGLAACTLLWWLYRRFDRRQQAALTKFVSPHLLEQLTPSVSVGRRTLKHVLTITGVACVFIALARPQAGYRWEETHRKGLDILFAVDTSKSMLTQDVKPDRLARAKMAVSDLVDKLDGDDVGLIAFAGDAFLQSPMTQDYDAFRESLDALDTSIIPRGGTDISRAIGEAQAAFQTQNDHDKILVLMTDGEDLEGSAITAAHAAAKDGVKIFTVGVGTPAGDLIPVSTDNGGTDFVKDADGQIVKSRLDETMLKKIAAATGGMYEPLGQQGQGLTAIYNQGLAPFQRHDLASRQHRVPLEQFQWPLLVGLCCLVAEFLIGTRKRLRRIAEAPMSSNAIRFAHRRPMRSISAAAALMLAVIAWPGFAHASPQSAEKAYQKGDYDAAERQYEAAAAKAAGAPQLQFNVGAAAYKAGMFDDAAKAFEKSLTTDQLNLQQETYYNLGNTQYRLGQQTAKTKPEQTIPLWKQAIQSYDAALQLNPNDADSIYNRDLVKKQLEKLQQQHQKQQQQQQQDNKDNKDQKNKDQSSQDQKRQNGNTQDQKNPSQDQTQNQSKQDQAKSGQNNQGEPKPDQNGQGQKNQDQKQQAGKQADQAKPDAGKDQSPQQAKAGDQPQSPKPDGQQQAGAQPQNAGSQASAQALAGSNHVPGQMTPEEAKALLNSLKDDEHRLPPAPIGRNQPSDDNTPPAKDW